jgi:hypothetical protein
MVPVYKNFNGGCESSEWGASSLLLSLHRAPPQSRMSSVELENLV